VFKKVFATRSLNDLQQVFSFAVICLSLFGLLMVYSASSVAAYDQLGDSFYLFRRQIMFFVLGVFVMNASSRIRPDVWLKISPIALGLSVLAMFVVHLPGVGHSAGGATRWIALGSFTVQPSEFVKLFAVAYFARLLSKKTSALIETWQFGVAPVLLFLCLLGAGMMAQPDFGNTAILFAVGFAMLFLAGARIKHLGILLIAAIPAVAYLIMGAGYRRQRLAAFLDPWADPTHSSYQILQSLSAFSSGGLFGKGLGNSQEKLFFLPKVHTDFIASVVGEELGFVGVLLLGLVFLFVCRYAFQVAAKTKTKGHGYLASGLGFMLCLQAVLNLAVVLGMVPTKGLPLPFISYGGSSLVVAFWACGLIQSVAKHDT